jgi:hypothetical protein
MILAAFDEKWSTQCCCRSVSLESKPAFHGPVPACAFGFSLFRFEGATPWPGLWSGEGGRIPGDVLAGLLISVAARVPRCRIWSRAHVRSSVPALCAVRALFRWSFMLGRRVDRSPRASPGRGFALLTCTMRCAVEGAGPGVRCAAP